MPETMPTLVETAQELGGKVVSNGDQPDVEIIDFDFDPIEAAEITRIAKLDFNSYVKSSPEYNKAKGTPDHPVKQWRQVWVDGDRVDSEGNAQQLFQNINLTYYKKDDSGAPEGDDIPLRGKNTLSYKLAEAFLALGVDASPNKPESLDLLGQFFKIKREVFKMGPEFEKAIWLPVEFIGDYESTVPEKVDFR